MEDSTSKQMGYDFSLVVILIVGFLGGVLANFLIAALKWVPDVAAGHPLFGAPFLTFVGVVIIVVTFYHPLKTLLSRGALTIKWGDREISITEIEESVDTQFHELESKLSNIVDEIEELKKSPYEAEKADAGEEKQRGVKGAGVLDAIKGIFPEATTDGLASIIFHLGSTDYKWRNQETLIKRTKLDDETIDSLVFSVPSLIIRSKAKSGNTIYRLTPEAKGKLRQVT